MSKIIQAINVIISNSDKISGVYRTEKEFFFVYNRKYKWSILQDPDEENYALFYYPSSTFGMPLEELVRISAKDWRSLDGSYVQYNTKDLKTKEALETFSELYLIVNERQLGVDNVLQDIIDDGKEPF